MKDHIKKFISNENVVSALLMIVLTLITYGPLIGELGYYQDDWYLLWSGQARGAGSIFDLFSTDRPFMGYVNYVDYLMLGDRVINWHIYALFWRIMLGLGVLWLLRLVWLNRKTETMMVALLVIVYPGFLSQPNGMNYKNYIFGFASGVYSILFMVHAFRVQEKVKRGLFVFISVILELLYVLLYEFMIGLEGLRFFILVYLILKADKADIKTNWKLTINKVFKVWWPYFLVMGSFVYWRFFVFKSTRPTMNETALLGHYLSDPVRLMLNFWIELGKDFFDTLFTAWSYPWYRLLLGVENRDLAAALIWTFVAVGLVIGHYLLNQQGEKSQDQDDVVLGKELVWLGGLGVITALMPVVFGGRQIIFDGFERYALHASLAVGMVIVGGILFLRKEVRVWIFIFLLGVGISTHIMNAQVWAEKWDLHRNVWWQLSWRAPQIEEDTVVIVYLPTEYRFRQDYEAWAPVNLIYGTPDTELRISAEVLNQDTAFFIQRGIEDRASVRVIKFERDFENTLIMSIPTTWSCLRVVDGILPMLSKYETPLIRTVARYSDINRINPESEFQTPSVNIFGEEPEHGWCYYYQKASLARQVGDWEEIARLGDEALLKDIKPLDRSEWMPFLEAYAILGRINDALWTKSVIASDTNLVYAMCQDLTDAHDILAAQGYDYDAVYDVLCKS